MYTWLAPYEVLVQPLLPFQSISQPRLPHYSEDLGVRSWSMQVRVLGCWLGERGSCVW